MACSTTQNAPETDSFYRLAEDRHCKYGDGGADFLQYPVWINKALNLHKCRERLDKALDKLNKKQKDHHDEPSPVEDIIDPDLLVCRPDKFDRDAWIEQRTEETRDSFGDWNSRFDTVEDEVAANADGITEHVKLRSTYQWMPTKFVIDENGHVAITTNIPQLEKIPKNEQIYKDIAQVFEAMLPAFQKSEIVGHSAEPGHTLQVIVKAQNYNLKAGMKYAGRWHTEGSTENIIAAGVYYVYFDDELKGGALKFRPKHAPQPWYEIPTDEEVSVSTDAAIVFSNSIPHRFRQIQNLTQKNGLRRTFLNFFIVDPAKPIDINRYSSRVLARLDVIIPILDQASEGRLIIGPILDKIIQHLGPTAWHNIEDAKEFRAKVRKAMLNEENGWGWITWGNCGFVEFVSARCLYKYKDDSGSLRHTESE